MVDFATMNSNYSAFINIGIAIVVNRQRAILAIVTADRRICFRFANPSLEQVPPIVTSGIIGAVFQINARDLSIASIFVIAMLIAGDRLRQAKMP